MEAGKRVSTEGPFLEGLVSGAVLGLIGTAIATLTQGEPDPPAMALLQLDSDQCRYVYSEAYRSAAKREKQNSALTGGCIGTAVAVFILLTSSN